MTNCMRHRDAVSLNNLSNRYGEVGRPAEGLAAIEEAVAIRRRLAAGRRTGRPCNYPPPTVAGSERRGARWADIWRAWPAPGKPLPGGELSATSEGIGNG
jgi:hypothetical protein